MAQRITLQELYKELINGLSDIAKDYVSDKNIKYSSYICDSISEYADSQVDIYYSDRAKWFAENWEKVDEAIAELGKSDNIMQDIASAQYLENSNELYYDLDEIKQALVLKYLINDLDFETIDEDLLDEIFENIEDIDNNNRLNDLKDKVDEILEDKEITKE
jgi:hypothetical protein